MAHFLQLVDLASERLGGAALAASDDFFAPKERLVLHAAPEWREHEYTDRGKWMDGWESRRKRTPGHDWCVLRLGLPGIVRGVVVDTAYFRGNYPEECSIEACAAPAGAPAEALGVADAKWHEILPRSPLLGDTKNLFAVHDARRCTHLRLNIFPDGGVARLRVHGEVVPEAARLGAGVLVDLAAIENGGWVVLSSDMFFGNHQNLIMPGRAATMGEGWETKRRRGPGHDWVVVRLAGRGAISRVEIDTSHFKGNFPDRAMLEVCDLGRDATTEQLAAADAPWRPVLGETSLRADTVHVFEAELRAAGLATHARLHIYPDGGVARLRLWGRVH